MRRLAWITLAMMACGGTPEEVVTEVEVRLSPAAPTASEDIVATWDVSGPRSSVIIRWEVDGEERQSVGDTVPAAWTTRGQTWSFTVLVDTPDGEQITATEAVEVVNALPTAPGARLEPTAPVAGGAPLRCVVVTDATDPDGDPLTYEARWYVDGVLFELEAGGAAPYETVWPGDTLPGTLVEEGQSWVCGLRADDGFDLGEEGLSDAGVAGPGVAVSVAVGDGRTCVQEEGEEAQCWGAGPGNIHQEPVGIGDVVMSDDLACGLDAMGEVRCWGLGVAERPMAGPFTTLDLSDGVVCAIDLMGDLRCPSAAPLEGDFASVSLGDAGEGCALGADGTASCFPEALAAPATVFDQVVVDAGRACGLTPDGDVTCWGAPWPGDTAPEGPLLRLDLSQDAWCGVSPAGALVCGGDSDALPAPDMEGIEAVALGAKHGCAATAGGAVSCWGADRHGESTVVTQTVSELSSGAGNTCMVLDDGAVSCFGSSVLGEAPAGAFDTLGVGWDHACARDGAGVLSCWGEGDAVGSPNLADLLDPVTTGASATCGVLAEGIIDCIGWVPAVPSISETPSAMELGGWGLCVLDGAGAIDCEVNTFTGPAPEPPGGAFAEVGVGAYFACARTTPGQVVCWGVGGDVLMAPAGVFEHLAVGANGACALDAAGVATCWGDMDSPAAGLPALASLTVAQDHACGVDGQGELHCWGASVR